MASLRPQVSYRLLACDYDGTLANDGRIVAPVEKALQEVRAAGLLLALVTGRALDDLLAVCPQIDLFDMVVAENGAVLYAGHRGASAHGEDLARPPPNWFSQKLERQGVTLHRGRVVLGIQRIHAQHAQDAIERHELPFQVLFNKDAAMILPNGVDKGPGLAAALRRLRVQSPEVIAVGDAENDLSLFQTAGLTVCPANALDEVKAHAHVVLAQPNGNGVVEFIYRYLLESPTP